MLKCGSGLNTTNTGEGVKKSKKIVFFVPSFSSIEATAPLGLLAISTPLLQAGYEVRIIDATITADYQQRILDEVKDALCLGISVVTGPMIKDTVEAAKAVKKWNPEFPVILGGWHPSLLPTQTLEADYIDIIVRGQGEESTLELIERLRDDAPLDDVRGIGFKQDGKIRLHAGAPPEDPRPDARPRRITWPILTPMSASVAAVGPCTFPALRVPSIVHTARTPACMAANGTLCRPNR